MIDKEALDGLITAVASVDAKGVTWERATNVRAESPSLTK
jgi:hypothetical protein